MNFVNNWSQAVTLAPGATSLALDIPDGTYRLTLADAAAGATRWEIVDAVVSAGAATLTRALEGTADQDWPAGSVIYCALTAGLMADLFASQGSSRSPVQTVAAAYTLTSADDGAYIVATADDLEFTLSTQAVGGWIENAELRVQLAFGCYILGATGVSLLTSNGEAVDVSGNYANSVITLKRIGLDQWVASGDVYIYQPPA